MSTSRMSTPKSSTFQLQIKNLPLPLASGMKFSKKKMAIKPMFAMRQGTLDCVITKRRIPITTNGKISSKTSGRMKFGMLNINSIQLRLKV